MSLAPKDWGCLAFEPLHFKIRLQLITYAMQVKGTS